MKPDNTQLPSPPDHRRHHTALPSSPYIPTQPAYPHQHLQWSGRLWRTALRASPITQCSGQAAGVTAHMSQHDQGVSRHACPLTFPTVRVQAESESRGKKLCFLFDSLSATIWSTRSLSPPWTVLLSHPRSLRLSPGLSLIVAQTSVSFMI